MTRAEHKQKSVEKIIAAAMEEYGTKEYAGVSINEICKKEGISKGIVYYYFTNVDALFLACVKKSFYDFEQFIQQQLQSADPTQAIGKRYIQIRQAFFQQYPLHCNIIHAALFQTPVSMRPEIEKCRAGMEKINCRMLNAMFDEYELRRGISREKAVDFVKTYMEIYLHYLNRNIKTSASNAVEQMNQTEKAVFDSLDYILFGLVINNDPQERNQEELK